MLNSVIHIYIAAKQLIVCCRVTNMWHITFQIRGNLLKKMKSSNWINPLGLINIPFKCIFFPYTLLSCPFDITEMDTHRIPDQFILMSVVIPLCTFIKKKWDKIILWDITLWLADYHILGKAVWTIAIPILFHCKFSFFFPLLFHVSVLFVFFFWAALSASFLFSIHFHLLSSMVQKASLLPVIMDIYGFLQEGNKTLK